MKAYNMHEAKTNLSKIINEVKEGEVIYIAKAGKKVAEIKPVEDKTRTIPWGKYTHDIQVADDWDSKEVNEEIASYLER